MGCVPIIPLIVLFCFDIFYFFLDNKISLVVKSSRESSAGRFFITSLPNLFEEGLLMGSQNYFRSLIFLIALLILHPGLTVAEAFNEYFCSNDGSCPWGGIAANDMVFDEQTGTWHSMFCACCAPSETITYCNGSQTFKSVLDLNVVSYSYFGGSWNCVYDNQYICNSTGFIYYDYYGHLLGPGSCSSTCPPPCDAFKGNCCQLQHGMGSSANVSSGNLYHSQTLFTMTNSKGLGDFVLSYNSLDSTSEPLGIGWTHNYNVHLTVSGDYAVVVEGDGKRGTLIRPLNGTSFTPASPWPVLTQNSDNTYLLTHKDGRKYYFNSEGKLTSIVDRNSNTTTFVYDASNNLITVTDSYGRVISISYNASNLISNIIDPNGNIHSFTYDNNTLYGTNILVGIMTQTPTETLNWTYTYSTMINTYALMAFPLMHTKTDPAGYTTTYTYDNNYYYNRVLTSTDPEGKVKTLSYPTTDTTTVTEKDGGVWTYKYNATLGTLTEKTDPLGGKTSYLYDARLNRTSETDPNNNTTTYTYDANNNMTSKKDPLNQITSYTYNGYGQVLTTTDPEGNVTTYDYDANGNLLSITEPSGGVTSYTYDGRGNVLTVTNAAGETTSSVYDQYNNLVSVTDPSGATTSFTYDVAGNMTSQTSATGETTTYVYNTLNQLVRVTDPLGNVSSYTYDAKGNRTSATDPNGNATTFTYNLNNQDTGETDALGNTTSYVYGGTSCQSCGGGGADKLTSVTDAEGHTLSYGYDLAGRMTKMTDQLGKVETYTYYPNGNLHTVTDRKGQITTYTYDSINRMTRADYAGGSYTTYGYNSIGQITSITDSVSGTITYTYTTAGSGMPVGRVLTETTPQGSITYAYDAVGRRTSMTANGQSAVNYGYDAGGRLMSVGATLGGSQASFGIGYDTTGRRTSVTYPNGSTTGYAYDNASRLTGLEHKNPLNAILESLGYGYDAAGNRISMDRQNVNLPSPGAVTSTSYNAANQMMGYNTDILAYDDNGNMTTWTNSCGLTTYTWDVRNRLIGISGFKPDCSSLTASFVYDALGRRIQKTINGRTIQYLYDGKDIVQEIENGLPSVNYIRTLNIDEPLARVDLATNTVRYYHADALGSIIGLSDENGQMVTTYAYDAFGQVAISGEISDNPFQYTGRENDGTGLYYYRARYYSPELQRFISEDPIRFAGGDVNFFVYVGNSPLNAADPMGLKSAGYGGWEFQFILGYGEVTVSCCDGKKLHQLKYRKVCFGGGFTAGVSGGAVSGSQGASCKNPPKSVISTEFGVPLIAIGPFGAGPGIEGGAGFSSDGGGAFAGGTMGVGGKATVCYYWLVSNTQKGCCKQ